MKHNKSLIVIISSLLLLNITVASASPCVDVPDIDYFEYGDTIYGYLEDAVNQVIEALIDAFDSVVNILLGGSSFEEIDMQIICLYLIFGITTVIIYFKATRRIKE